VSLRYLQAQACCRGLVLIEPADSANMIDHPAFAFRFEDQALRDAVDAKLAAYLGSPRHQSTVAPFGFLPEQPTP
jgi:polar amino acid transport system substrate-binding protein